MITFLIYLLACLGKRDDSVIVILCRNSDLEDIKETLKNFEERFNAKYNYPYVFLNDKNWDDKFKKEIESVVSGEVTFGKVDEQSWNPPKSIDMEYAKKQWKEMAKEGVPYVEKLSYHNMCRFFSKSFYHHPLLLKYKYYWRIEPSVKFRCPINFDPFETMSKNGYIYGFTILIREWMPSIKTLGKETAKFLKQNEDLLPAENKPLEFMFENGKYNGCHFWSNFEIGDFDFFRDKLYTLYIKHLEQKNGFYYERWGDAPVHSLALALFADKRQIHFFNELGYTHPPFTHCPEGISGCDCKVTESIDWQKFSCLKDYFNEMKNINDVKNINEVK